jgi:hypothetical protein
VGGSRFSFGFVNRVNFGHPPTLHGKNIGAFIGILCQFKAPRQCTAAAAQAEQPQVIHSSLEK